MSVAKIDFELGDYQSALNDLDVATKSNLSNVNDVFNTGGVKPEDASNRTVLTFPDFNKLISALPSDNRSYMYRGLFYNSFSFFDTNYYAPAIADLQKASSLNPQSALPPYFLGTVEEKMGWNNYAFKLNGEAQYESMRNSMNGKALGHFDEAIRLDPNLKEANAAEAEMLYALKEYVKAIPAFDRAIQQDPNNAGLINDRGLAKSYAGDYFGAVTDFSDSIRLKEKVGGSPTTSDYNLTLTLTYDNRADAYAKSGNYDLSIDDYGKEIGLKLGSGLLITPLLTIRAVYPELNNISDEDLLEGLRQKYNPAMSASDFAAALKSNKGTPNSTLADDYAHRADAHLKAGKYRQAAADYQRSTHLIPSYSPVLGEDRWKEVTSDSGTTYSIDALTLDFSKAYPSVWLKSVVSDGSYIEENYQLNCASREIKGISATRYDAAGNAIGSIGGQDWQSVIPETIGETLYSGTCS